MELIEVMRKLESPPKDAWALAFIMSDQGQDLFAYMAIPPPWSNIEELNPQDYQIKEVILGKPTLEIVKLMFTTRMKELFRSLE